MLAGTLDLLGIQDGAVDLDPKAAVYAAGMVMAAVAVRVVLWVLRWVVLTLVPVAVVALLVYLALHGLPASGPDVQQVRPVQTTPAPLGSWAPAHR